MIFSTLMLVSLVGSSPPPSAPTLVERLGSPRYADREQAAATLLELGPAALDALREGRHARDAEVRARAAALLERVQGQLMVRPTMVALDFRDRPLLDVARVLGQRSGMTLEPEEAQDPGFWLDRRVTLETSRPVPFWTALDRLCVAGNLRYGGAFRPFGPPGPGGGLLLMPRTIGRNPAPTSDSGPFRVKLMQLHYERNWSFEEDADAPTEEFRVALETWAEPRLLIAQAGPPELTEAVDDLGRSLMPPSPMAHHLAFAPAPAPGFGPIGMIEPSEFQPLGRGMVPIQMALNFPKAPAPATLRRFRGTIPMAVASRKPDPLIVPLAGAVGKTFGGDGELRILIRGIKPGADLGQPTLLDLTAIPRRGASTGPAGGGGEGLTLPAFAAPEHQIEVLDARGRPVSWTSMDQEFDAEGVRLTLGILPDDESGAPAMLRIYDLSHAPARVPFDFTNIRLH